MLAKDYVINELQDVRKHTHAAIRNCENLRRKDGSEISDITEEPTRLDIIESSIASAQKTLSELRNQITVARTKKKRKN